MSQDPAPYTTSPALIRVGLAVHADPALRAAIPWQGIVLWREEHAGFAIVSMAPLCALLSKS